MTIQAQLHRIHLQSAQPQRLVDFYVKTYNMDRLAMGAGLAAVAQGRQVLASEGIDHQLHYFLYAVDSTSAWERFKTRTAHLPKADVQRFTELPESALAFRDPDGNCVVFVPQHAAPEHAVHEASADTASGQTPPAETQHLGLRTPQIGRMLEFYSQSLGFVVSDRVHDEAGQLRACFLRTGSLHHSLALFGAPVSCFDHQSFEAPSWEALKLWADRMGDLRQEIVWGVGRHGPGNDVFFMVRDPDGNLAEISSEIEVCAADRPMGIWKHEERTLNLWGKAIMRS